VLYALRFPLSFAVLAVTFVAGLCARGFTQRLLTGQRRPAWARRLTRRRSLLWLRPFVDPYGGVGAVLGGLGWGAPLDAGDGRGRVRPRTVAALLAGPVVLGGLGVVALIGFRMLFGQLAGNEPLGPRPVLDATHGSLAAIGGQHIHYFLAGHSLGYGALALLLAGIELLAMGVLAILPMPPLDGGRLLFALVPRTGGWHRARYRLEEDNWGALIVLVLTFPLRNGAPLIMPLMDAIIDPIIRALVG
jgi:hypothetical protein